MAGIYSLWLLDGHQRMRNLQPPPYVQHQHLSQNKSRCMYQSPQTAQKPNKPKQEFQMYYFVVVDTLDERKKNVKNNDSADAMQSYYSGTDDDRRNCSIM